MGLIIYALLSIGAIIALVLTIKALRRIARNHERSVALLEELVQQQRSAPQTPDRTERIRQDRPSRSGRGRVTER